MLLIAGHFACAAFRNANLFKLETFFPGTKSIGVASYWALGKTKKEITIIETTNKRKEMTFDSHCDWLPAKRRHQQVHARASWKPPSQKMFIGPSENYWFSLCCLLSKFYWNKTVCIEYLMLQYLRFRSHWCYSVWHCFMNSCVILRAMSLNKKMFKNYFPSLFFRRLQIKHRIFFLRPNCRSDIVEQ